MCVTKCYVHSSVLHTHIAKPLLHVGCLCSVQVAEVAVVTAFCRPLTMTINLLHMVDHKLQRLWWCSGHSLGAGVAALMTLRLKDRYPSAKCWAFCPPGGLMSANLSHAAQGFVNCVVVGKDIVPRLSVVNIGRLIDELVRCSRQALEA